MDGIINPELFMISSVNSLSLDFYQSWFCVSGISSKISGSTLLLGAVGSIETDSLPENSKETDNSFETLKCSFLPLQV